MTTRSPRRFGRALGVALACLLALTLMTSSTAMAGFPWLEFHQVTTAVQATNGLGDGPDPFGDYGPVSRPESFRCCNETSCSVVDDPDPQVAAGAVCVIIDDGSPF